GTGAELRSDSRTGSASPPTKKGEAPLVGSPARLQPWPDRERRRPHGRGRLPAPGVSRPGHSQQGHSQPGVISPAAPQRPVAASPTQATKVIELGAGVCSPTKRSKRRSVEPQLATFWLLQLFQVLGSSVHPAPSPPAAGPFAGSM